MPPASSLTQTMYVRIRGKPVGPLDDEKVQELIRQGKISKVSEVSSDGQQWVRASEYAGLFSSHGDLGNDLRLTDGLTPGASRKHTSTALSDSIPIAERATSENCIWFYSIDGRSGFGPMTRREIGDLIRKGTLTPDSLLWKQGEMADTVRYTPDFAEFLIPKHEEHHAGTTPSAAIPATEQGSTVQKPTASSAGHDSTAKEQVVWEVLRAGPWIMFLAIIASIGVAVISLGLLASVCFLMSRLNGINLLVAAGLSVSMIALMVRPLLMLWKLQSAISRLAVEQTDEKLREVLRRYYYIFRSLVIHILVLSLLGGVSLLLFAMLLGKFY